MKIVMLCEIYDEKVQYQDNLFAKYYTKHGHEVTVAAATIEDIFAYTAGQEKYDPKKPATESWDGKAKIVRLPFSINMMNRLRKLRGVRELLEREKPDLIFSHDIHLNLWDAVKYKKSHRGCRLIMDYHADYSNSARSWASLLLLHKLTRKPLLDFCRPSIDRIYVVVPASADFLHEVYGVPHRDMELLPLGADTDHARDVSESRVGARIRRELEIPDDALVVFTGGKLAPEKRTHVLIDAISASASNLHLIVVGDAHAAYKRLLERKAAGQHRVHFVGWVEGANVYKYMNACDLAVFPASQSVLWQQCLSMGLPLIVGRVGVQDPSYMNPYNNIVIIDESDITSTTIARTIKEITADPNALRERQRAARRAADEFLNYHILVQQTLGTDRDQR